MPTRDVLLRAKCRGLVRTRWPEALDDPATTEHDLPGGAAIADPTTHTAYVLAEDHPGRSLGGALVWVRRHQATTLHLLVTGDVGRLARRAAAFAEVDVTVWRIDRTVLAQAAPAPLEPDPAPDPRAEAFRALFGRAGATTVAEHGVLRAEVRGLEVARIEIDEHTQEPRLAVGVGKHDREAQREIRGDAQTFDHLFEVVRIVAEHRVADGAGHAAYHLSSERWLRDVIIRNPGLVGANDDLEPRPSPNPRDDLRAPAPAPAGGTTRDTGAPLLVVCSVGTDLDLVPAAVDARQADGREPHVRLVVPEGDDLPSTRDLVGMLAFPADLVTVAPDWRTR